MEVSALQVSLVPRSANVLSPSVQDSVVAEHDHFTWFHLELQQISWLVTVLHECSERFVHLRNLFYCCVLGPSAELITVLNFRQLSAVVVFDCWTSVDQKVLKVLLCNTTFQKK